MTRLPRLPMLTLVILVTAAGLPGATQVAVVSPAGPAPFLLNESRSLPRGLYLRTPRGAPHPGDIVAIRPPPQARPYLATLRYPPGARLLKRVAATGGDLVCAAGDRVQAPGTVRTRLAHDRRGTPLPAWEGCGPLAPGQVFLLGDTATSFDSRYFGPRPGREIEGVYRQVLRW